MRRWSNRGGRTSVLAIPMRCSFHPGSPCFHTLDHRPPLFSPFLLPCSLACDGQFPPLSPFLCCGSLHTPAHLFTALAQFSASLYRTGHLDFPGPGLDTFIFYPISILIPSLSASVYLAFNTASLIQLFIVRNAHAFASVQLRHVVILPANLLLPQNHQCAVVCEGGWGGPRYPSSWRGG